MKLVGIPDSTYYNLVERMNRPNLDANLKAKTKAIYEEYEGRYGYCLFRYELENRWQTMNHKRSSVL